MTNLKPVKGEKYRYTHIVGTGGIGSGIFFSMEGSHTLGRNESRLGRLEPYKDYCKQHIIMHYVAVLLGSTKSGTFQLFPIGKVGNDETGHRLLSMMEKVGMNTNHIAFCNNASTLFSVSFQYPDYSGGNITSSNSASSKVQPEDISFFFQQYQLNGNEGIALVAPEVPVITRISLLKYGRKFGLFNVASVLTSEIEEFTRLEGFELTDLLAINIDEAQQIAAIEGDQTDSQRIIDACIQQLQRINPEMTVIITDGSRGSYTYYKHKHEFIPSLKTEVISTAGAGDAFLAGTISGLCCGLPLFRGFSTAELHQSPLQTAVELGTVLASFSVTSADTIHEGANAESIDLYIKKSGLKRSREFSRLFF
jgi:sugar/nucleoside kinase (ribokinase family)